MTNDTQKEKCWSHDEERYETDFDDVCQQVWDNLDAHAPEVGTFTIYEGEVREIPPSYFLRSWDRIIEDAQERACDECGEVTEGWLEKVTTEQGERLEELMVAAFVTWLRETGNKPTFWLAENVRPITVRYDDDANFEIVEEKAV